VVISTLVPLAAGSGTVVLSGGTYWVLRLYGFGVRYWRMGTRDGRQAHRDAAYIARTRKRLFYDLRLYLKVKPRRASTSGARAPKIKYPKLKKIRADNYGVVADFTLVPTVRLKDFTDRAEDFANHWQMVRVSAIQTEPNRVRVRAVRRDPLITKTIAVFDDHPASLRSYPAGLDDFATPADIRIHHGSGLGVFGLPTFGKTSFIMGFITYFAPSNSAVFLIADGKSTTGYEGDYLDIAPRAHSVIGDDLEIFNMWIKQIERLRAMRAATIRQALGVRNFWDAGPTPEWPVIFPIIDECHTFFEQVSAGGGSAMQNRNALAAENAYITSNIVRKGQSVGIMPVLATQKGTSDAIPTMIRDNMHASVCFAVKTDEAAQAALGRDIRAYPDASPVSYQHEDYIGVATMSAANRPGYVRFRSPYCRDVVAADICERTAHLVRSEVCPGIDIGQDHRALLSAADQSDLLNLTDFDKDCD
jgi:S-DNA-T family DNA segregation ATPase FtsK/SpoIIIE